MSERQSRTCAAPETCESRCSVAIWHRILHGMSSVSTRQGRKPLRSDAVKTPGECLEGSREQLIIAADELDIVTTRDFQTPVVVMVKAEARLIAYQSGSVEE